MNEIITLVDEQGLSFKMHIKPCKLNLTGTFPDIFRSLDWHEIRRVKDRGLGRIVFVAHDGVLGYVMYRDGAGYTYHEVECKDLRDMLTQKFSNN